MSLLAFVIDIPFRCAPLAEVAPDLNVTVGVLTTSSVLNVSIISSPFFTHLSLTEPLISGEVENPGALVSIVTLVDVVNSCSDLLPAKS